MTYELSDSILVEEESGLHRDGIAVRIYHVGRFVSGERVGQRTHIFDRRKWAADL